MLISTAKLTSTPSELHWSQYHDSKPEDKKTLKEKGRLIAVVSAKLNASHGRQILTDLHNLYFNSLDSPLNSIKGAIELLAKKNESLAISCLCFVENKILLACYGGGQIFVGRRGSLAKIIQASPSVQTASGFAQKGDTFLLSTHFLDQKLSTDLLRSALASPSPEAAVETLTPAVNSNFPEEFALAAVSFYSQDQIQKISETPAHQPQAQKPLKLKVVNFLDKLIERLPEKKLVIKSETTDLEQKQRKKTAVTVGILLLILLVVSIGFGIKQKGDKASRADFETRLAEASHNFEEASSISSLNPTRARELIVNASDIISKLKSEGYADQSLLDLQDKISQEFGKITGRYETTPEMYLDLSLITPDFKAVRGSLSDERLLVLDASGTRIVEIRLSSKKTNIVAGPSDISDVIDTAAYATRNYALSTSEILEITTRGTSQISDDAYEQGTLLSAFAGNLYVLDQKEGIIWRYPGVEGKFSARSNWLSQDSFEELKSAVSFSIDGTIWVLTNQGKILRLAQGSPTNFIVTDLPGSLSQAQAIYTDEDSRFLYVLDQKEGRVVLLDKNGKFSSEYVSETIKEASNLIVSESQKIMLLFAQEKLYSVPLKHLE